ncbi:bifunctional 6-phosphofructo-2-kinase/fructose-2,6-bisphosphate 2-phosphatase [Myriangium duriaei CBS 260.36]|uniref:Bifunctional 6-phosphofructo-2-kinase/fructose-2,6-bisphosphate 2-phosphatase n=1 Tax=Myriangium duriaei CBS 260.36 TaxID=1168546 RepID=A0A9P4MKD2_9PEZI|nr:bifunctional 6-phosphofructo-2-kinase/fructose-2,6-bisphosphate 2-phosphatase [Myriangium duriaei CBS 260.36]
MASVGANSIHNDSQVDQLAYNFDRTLPTSPSTSPPTQNHEFKKPLPPHGALSHGAVRQPSLCKVLSDTPDTTAPNSPRMLAGLADDLGSLAKIGLPKRQNSGSSTPRIRPTTLDIPGLTKSKVSPDGRIASRDVGAKLVIVMVGLPARGKSYITKKLARYLNWLQHDTRIFNVGERRRARKATLLLPEPDHMDQSASFFDPSNREAAHIREQCAMETLDELLDYILDGNGSVGILDATNSTLERRKTVMKRIRERAGPDLNVLFLESRCLNEQLLESNMRLKLSGPDYKDKDPVAALEDFRRRVALYEKKYVPLGDYEEQNEMPYIQMIDVGRKIISHQIKGFLMAQANYYLLNFNLAPRQIWITRHGLSQDNISGKIGGDSDLSEEGVRYARALTRFMNHQRNEWELRQIHKMQHSHFPPQPGDTTPPNPHYEPNNSAYPHSPEASDAGTPEEIPQKPFCIWTSMLKRSIQTGQFFDEEEYDIKQMRMLDELNAGIMEGLTYSSIASVHPQEYAERKKDKLHYRYPGPGGEGYLDIINRLRPVIVELERMTDHCLLIGHRSVARVLLAYFLGLKREEVAELDVPIGVIFSLEPMPYGVRTKFWRFRPEDQWFYEDPDFKLQRDEKDML